MRVKKNRPFGIVIIAILTVFGSVQFLASGRVLLEVVMGIGVVLLALGIAYLAMAYGVWYGKRWAWTITLILSAIGLLLSVREIAGGNIGGILGIIIYGTVIYYLYRPNVKAYFGI
jgi:uncharacterized membrane protein (DUF2068 family)